MSVLWISVDDRASCLCRLWGRAELWDENSSLRCGKKKANIGVKIGDWSEPCGGLVIEAKLISFHFHSSGWIKKFIYIFQKRHIRNIRDKNLTCWHFNDRLIAGGRIGGIKGMSPGSATISPPQTTARLVSFAIFFRLFPKLRSLVPGCKNCCSNIYFMCIFYRVVWLY